MMLMRRRLVWLRWGFEVLMEQQLPWPSTVVEWRVGVDGDVTLWGALTQMTCSAHSLKH